MFGAPSCGVFVLVCLKEETHRRIMDNHLVAVGAELFLFPWGFVLTAVVAAAAFASAASAALTVAASATLGESAARSVSFCAMTSNTSLCCSQVWFVEA